MVDEQNSEVNEATETVEEAEVTSTDEAAGEPTDSNESESEGEEEE